MATLDRKRAFLCFLGVFALLLVACGGESGRNGSGVVDAHPIQPTLRPEATEPTLSPRAATVPAPALPPATSTAVPSPIVTRVATGGKLFLQMVAPVETEVLTSEPSLDIIGRTRVDAVVTINDTVVEPGLDGQFSLGIDLEEGPNIIKVVASVASGEQQDVVLVVIYVS